MRRLFICICSSFKAYIKIINVIMIMIFYSANNPQIVNCAWKNILPDSCIDVMVVNSARLRTHRLKKVELKWPAMKKDFLIMGTGGLAAIASTQKEDNQIESFFFSSTSRICRRKIKPIRRYLNSCWLKR